MTKDEPNPYLEEETCAESVPYSFEYIGPEMTLDELADILDTTIKKDRTAKLVTFLGFLSNYTTRGQQNLGFVSVSSSGKSYIPTEIAKFFPSMDVLLMQHQTPKALYHSRGVLVRDDGGTEYGPRLKERGDYVREALSAWMDKNPRGETKANEYRESVRTEKARLKDEWDQIPKGVLVDLRQKIIIFLDQPHWQLMSELKPLLSHDAPVTRSSITDKSKSGSLATKTVFLRGFPTVVFLTVKTDLDEQVRNRMLLLSASIAADKIEASLSLISHRNSDDDFEAWLVNDTRRLELRERVMGLKYAGIDHVRFKKDDIDRVQKTFQEKHPRLISRHQRDYPRLLSLIKENALLNYMHRKRDGEILFVNEKDIAVGEALYDEIAVANELGIEPELYEFAVDVLAPAFERNALVAASTKEDLAESQKQAPDAGISKSEFRQLWYGYSGSQLSDYSLKRKLEMLETVGQIEVRKDGREKRIYSNIYDTVFAHASEQTTLDGADNPSDENESKEPSKQEKERMKKASWPPERWAKHLQKQYYDIPSVWSDGWTPEEIADDEQEKHGGDFREQIHEANDFLHQEGAIYQPDPKNGKFKGVAP